jgi:hypothetical protein
MLECQVLLIHPLDAAGRRVLADASSGATLGYAQWRRSGFRAVLAVHELDDEPLVFTLRRWWLLLGRRVVCDAEGQIVGLVDRTGIQDRWGCRLASWEPGENRFRGKEGQSLAVLEHTREGCRLTFSSELEGEPFLKMLLLAAVLVE